MSTSLYIIINFLLINEGWVIRNITIKIKIKVIYEQLIIMNNFYIEKGFKKLSHYKM